VPEKIVCHAPPLYGSTSTVSRFGERFRAGQYNLVSLMLAVFLLAVPQVPTICKSGGTCPVPWSRRRWEGQTQGVL